MPREIFEVRGLSRIEPYVRKLVKDTSELQDPTLMISVGKLSNKVDQVLKMASDCKCTISVRALLHENVRDLVLDALRNSGHIKISEEHIVRQGDIPSFLVSKAGYYVQDGLNFDEAVLSFKNKRIRDFLIEIFEDRISQRDAA